MHASMHVALPTIALQDHVKAIWKAPPPPLFQSEISLFQNKKKSEKHHLMFTFINYK